MESAVFEEVGDNFDSVKNPRHRLWLNSSGFVLVRGSKVISQGIWEGGSDMGCILYPEPVPKGKDPTEIAFIGS